MTSKNTKLNGLDFACTFNTASISKLNEFKNIILPKSKSALLSNKKYNIDD